MNGDRDNPHYGFGLTAQAVAVISLVLLAANLLLGGVLVNQSRESMKSLLEQRMLDVSNTAAAMLDGDALEKLEAQDEHTPPYQDALTKLRFFQDNVKLDLKYIYGIRDMGDGTFTFTIDPTVADPGEFGEPIVATDALRQAAKGKPTVDATPYEDKWGRFYSAYSPVFNSRGGVAGIVAVDLDATWFENQISRQARSIVVSCIASLAFGAGIVFFLTIRLRRRFTDLSRDVSRLAGGLDALMEELNLPEDAAHRSREEQASDAPPADESAPNAACATDGAKAGPPSRPSRSSRDEIGLLAGRVRSMGRRIQHYLHSSQSQAYSMIAALSADYRSVFFIDLETDTAVCYRADAGRSDRKEGEVFPFRASLMDHVERYVAAEYRAGFLRLFEPGYVMQASKVAPVLTYRYLTTQPGRESYELVRIACTGPQTLGMSFSDVDAETRRAMQQSQALREALAAAEEASHAKTAFLSSMSHEIRTPMNAILGLNSIALSDPAIPPSTRSHLERIGSSARHLLNLINDILDMSRIESGRLSIASAEFSFSALLEQVNVMIGGQCQEKGLAYRCEMKGRFRDYYVGDGMKLKQVLINILGNAVKFTPRGGAVSLEVGQAGGFDGKAALRFVIRDTGIGMDKAFLPKLFKPFSQEDSSSTSRYGSTGLGLAITKNIVELMHGTITADSEKGKGTAFTVTVTLAESSRIVSDRAGDGFDPSRLKALLVDGDGEACGQACSLLAEAGVETDAAAALPEALDRIGLAQAGEPYGLVVVDWKSSGMDGMAQVSQIRQVAGPQAVVLLAANAWDDIRQDASSAGADGFIAKPLFAGAILETFRQVQRRRLHDERGEADPGALKGRRILLAEDNALNAEIILTLLHMRDMDVDVAVNGRLCLEQFQASPEWHYDAILMDMRMPEMDGIQATEAIRRLDRPDAGRIPIIALTANAFTEDVAHSLQAGLNAHLSKPVEPERLYATLAAFLAR